MSLKKGMLVLVFILGSVVVSTAQSQNKKERKAPPTFAQLLKEMDANEDGKLAEKEIRGPLKENFDTVDADEDGYITEEEFKKAPKPKGRSKKK